MNASGLGADEARCFCGRPLDMVEVHVAPTTGGQFQLKVAASDNVDYLKRLISKRLRVPKERICLLYRDRHLRDGTLVENSIVDGARLTLLPSVETGLLTQRPEQSVMQALESLNDGQVTDFLSGKAPLNLTMRLGDHMMLIQLQLSTVSPANSRRSSARGSTLAHAHDHHTPPHSQYLRQSSNNISHCSGSSHSSCYGAYGTPQGCPSSSSNSNVPAAASPSRSATSLESNPIPPPIATSISSSHSTPPAPPPHHHYHYHHHHHHHHNHHHSRAGTSSATPAVPAAAATSTVSPPASSATTTAGGSSSNFFDTEPLVRGCPHQKLDDDPKAAIDTRALAEASRNLTQTLKQLSNEVMTPKGRSVEKQSFRAQTQERKRPHPDKVVPVVTTAAGSQVCGINVNTCAPAAAAPSVKASSKRQGAIIESMHHHGKGVYSGTFSGTLNPALQDRQGRPKRDISTIIHILNDLLCATPQYRRTSSSKASENSLRNINKAFASTFNQEDLINTSNLLHRDKMDVDQAKDITRKEIEDAQVTRTKLKQLRFIMEQTRAQRKARREARFMPYPSVSTSNPLTTTWSSEATTLVSEPIPADQSQQPMDVKSGEDGDSNTLCELNSGTIVA